jgi:hypothetical protein
MRTRFPALLAAALLAVGIGIVKPTPALAADGGKCSMNSFCLYQWRDFGAQVAGDRWQSTLQNIYNHPNHCVNIPPAKWANGTSVADNSGSAQYNLDVDEWGSAVITVYNWAGCNPGGGSYYFQNDRDTPGPGSGAFYYNLNVYTYPRTSITLYHSITSISVRYEPA